MTLPRFKRNPTCPKCGNDGTHFHYLAAKSRPPGDDHRESPNCSWQGDAHWQEHIHLECSRCSYGKQQPWIMAIAENPDRTVGFRLPSGSTGVVAE